VSSEPATYCTQCGKEARSGAKFCAHCGSPLVDPENSLPQGSQSPLPTTTDPPMARSNMRLPLDKRDTGGRTRGHLRIMLISVVGVLVIGVGISAYVLMTRDGRPVPVVSETTEHVAPEPAESTTIATAPTEPSTTLVRSALPDSSGHPRVVRVSPSNKTLLVGETVKVTAEVKGGPGAYVPAEFHLETEDPDVASTDGERITAVGEGETRVHVRCGNCETSVLVEVFTDVQSRDEETEWGGPLIEDPIYSDGRASLCVWSLFDASSDTIRISGSLTNTTSASLTVSANQFRLLLPTGVKVLPGVDSGFCKLEEGQNVKTSPWTIEPGSEAGLTLFFDLPQNVTWASVWLVWQDQESMISVSGPI